MPAISLTRPRGTALLSPARPPSSADADRWLIRLRWMAIGGMLATTLIASRLVPDLDLGPLLGVLGGIVALNVAWIAVVVSRVDKPPLVRQQVVVDVVALTAMLWFSGGASNPFAAFLTFQIVLAGLLCGGRMSVVVAGLVLAAIAISWFAPPLPLEGAPLGAADVRRIGNLVSLVSLAAFIGFFVIVYVQRIEQLRADNERNEKLAMLGRLVGAMSHELNTPLATILLASKDLVEVGGELGSVETTRLASTIVEEAQRAADVIGLMRGHVRPDQLGEPVELGAFVNILAARELDRLGFHGDRVIDVEAVLATVPRAGFQQILSNLITNAVQATAAMPAPRIEVRVRARGGRVETVVADNGPGIDRALVGRIGEPFQTTKEGGMGLGLYVSSVLAERMEGTLALEAGDSSGTRVTLTVPRRRS